MTKVILDTDMLTDCDDAGALAMLHALADNGEAEIMGVVLNGIDTNKNHSAVVSAINCHFGRGDIPIGTGKQPPDHMEAKASAYSNEIFKQYSHDGLTDTDRPDAVDMYEELLSAAEDNTVVIISIGFLTNLKDLLQRDGGKKLAAAKVRLISIMGGEYPSGKEYNFNFGGTGPVTKSFMEHWPDTIPMTFTGFSLGQQIITGTAYKSAPDSPMKKAYELAYDSINKGRPSWDQVAVLYGVRREKPWFTRKPGRNIIDDDGCNTWQDDTSSPHGYLEAAVPPENIAAIIEELMLHRPRS